ncbi:hypothetical protein JKP88DRAFT_353286, partial [Tribonema minus]
MAMDNRGYAFWGGAKKIRVRADPDMYPLGAVAAPPVQQSFALSPDTQAAAESDRQAARAAAAAAATEEELLLAPPGGQKPLVVLGDWCGGAGVYVRGTRATEAAGSFALGLVLRWVLGKVLGIVLGSSTEAIFTRTFVADVEAARGCLGGVLVGVALHLYGACHWMPATKRVAVTLGVMGLWLTSGRGSLYLSAILGAGFMLGLGTRLSTHLMLIGGTFAAVGGGIGAAAGLIAASLLHVYYKPPKPAPAPPAIHRDAQFGTANVPSFMAQQAPTPVAFGTGGGAYTASLGRGGGYL